MKYLLSIIITSFMLMSCNAQTLKVTYTEKMDISKQLEGIDDPAIKKIVAQQVGAPKYFSLTSSNQISIYENKKEETADNSNSNVTVMGNGAETDIIYKNHKNRKFVRQTDFMSRTFLIQDNLLKIDWKITNETQKIGKYLCRKATLKQGDNEIIAWFTDEISSNDGPREYYGLPGLILKVSTPSVTIEATDVTLSKEKVELEKPTKGKKVTREEFEKIKKDKINSLTGGQTENGVKVIKM